MNSVTQLIHAMPLSDLKESVLEMKEMKDTGILREGVVRRLTQSLSANLHIPVTDAQSIAQTAVLERAAFLWADAL